MTSRRSVGAVVWIAMFMFAVIGCGTSPVPASMSAPVSAPTPVANVTVSGTGFVACGEVPAYACVYAIDAQGPDGVVHQGWFDYPRTTSPVVVTGDVSMHLDPGSWRFTFRQERVSDTVSFLPVPSGTPEAVSARTTLSTCATSVVVTPSVQVTIAVDFGPSPCVASNAVGIE
jgi:hypothetical protein